MAQAESRQPGIGTGIYTIAEAARLLKVPRDKLKRWANEYHRTRDGKQHVMPPVIERNGSAPGILTFFELIELAFVREFRKAGVRMERVREAHEALRSAMSTPYPFATKRFGTDGAQILDKENLHDVATKQAVFEYVREMFKDLETNEAELAAAWYPMGREHLVVLDPSRSFGAPIDRRSGVRTEILYRAFLAEGNEQAVADWYEVETEAVREAVEFESQMASAA